MTLRGYLGIVQFEMQEGRMMTRLYREPCEKVPYGAKMWRVPGGEWMPLGGKWRKGPGGSIRWEWM